MADTAVTKDQNVSIEEAPYEPYTKHVDEKSQGNHKRRCCGVWRFLEIIRLITVEPVLFTYMFAFMLTSVVEQAFYVDKACRVSLNFTDDICSNIEQKVNQKYKEQVQVEVASFLQYNAIASNAVPIILALLLGAWSDRRGRKFPLLLGLAGQIYFVLMLTVAALNETWSLNTILMVASFPSALTGTNLAIFAATFSYLADITTAADRTMRIALMDAAYLASMPIGVALGGYLFTSVVQKSFAAMFAINCTLLTLAFLYTLIRLKWRTTNSQQPLNGYNVLGDFFDWDHISGSVRTVVRRRHGYRRLYILLIILSMSLYTFQRHERSMSYLYTQFKFHWDITKFSNFRTFQTTVYVIVTLLAAPLLTKICGVKDSTIVLVGAPAHAIARVIFALAEVPWLFYFGAAVSSLGPTVAPVLRSMTSKIVPMNERGKVFALLAVADSATPLVSSAIYSEVYKASIDVYPAAFYWVTVASQLLLFFFILFIHVSLGKEELESAEETSD